MLIGGFCGRGDLLVVIQNATITDTAVDYSEPGLVIVGRLVDMIEVYFFYLRTCSHSPYHLMHDHGRLSISMHSMSALLPGDDGRTHPA